MTSAAAREQRGNAGENVPQGDERHIDGDDVDERRQVARLERSRVGALDDHDARIVAESPVELSVADVVGNHAYGPALQQHVGEAARGCPDIERFASLNGDAELVERVRELDAASTHIRVVRRLQRDRGIVGDLLARFADSLAIDQHDPRENQRGRAFARLRQATADEQTIETNLQSRLNCFV